MWRSRKIELPIAIDDKDWLEEAFLFFEARLGKDFLLNQPMVLPTRDFFNRDFKNTENDAYYVLERVAHIMQVDPSGINLTFYREPSSIELTEGLATVQDGDYQLTAGKYLEYSDGGIEIMVEGKQLMNPVSLIATIAHEVTHLKLLREDILKENDELLTEIAMLVYGFGIFNANTAMVRMDTWSGFTHTGWRVSGGDGYLHYKIHGFALALYANYRHEIDPEWTRYLDKEVRKVFKKSLNYIANNIAKFKFIN